MQKETLIRQEILEKRIKEMAKEIEKDYEGKEITFICILKGSIYFFSELTKNIKNKAKFEFMRPSSYNGTISEDIKLKIDLENSIEGKDVIVLEDIIDTGKTLNYLLKHLEKQKPNSLKLCTLLDKPSRREIKGIKVDYIGFTIDDYFVVGYGLDLNEEYRNLPEIDAFVKNEEESKKLMLVRKNIEKSI